ncbi:class I SAM-dependent methyltransferase [Gilvibacter sp.]|uniref:class I SAM-dependent methyltransferase n=1 Tax=Gilvibacter sp. TaxID=2729997 RepID=UPI0025B9C20C|nr:class I SAM-dependent methyltransferase [Gilvibacter sp.]NQX78830.1 class I SAM-dependent methyltransferase [Gilvibacter sp.]
MNLELLASEAVQAFILEHLKEDPHQLALKKSEVAGVSMPEIAQQVAARQRIKAKLTKLYDRAGLVFPPKLNLEQSSSEQTAAYKAAAHSGKHLLDLTGGLGIDSMAFAERFEQVTYCEHNAALAKLAAHNFKILGFDNITVHSGDGTELLETQAWDMIYCDPDRRSKVQRAFKLEDCEPNVIALQEQLLANSAKLLIKAPPMLDLRQAQSALKHLSSIEVVAVKGEVKELLLLAEPNTTQVIERAINIGTDGTVTDTITAEVEPLAYSDPQAYLYLPHGALMKLQAYDYISAQYSVHKLAKHSHVFTADQSIDFPGRRFRVTEVLPYDKRQMKSFLKKDYLVIAKNFPLTVAQLRQKFKLKDAGDKYLIFTTLKHGSWVVITAELDL